MTAKTNSRTLTPLPVNRKYQICHPLKPEHFATLESDILARGVLVAVELDQAGNLLDGFNRVAIACEILELAFPYRGAFRVHTIR